MPTMDSLKAKVKDFVNKMKEKKSADGKATNGSKKPADGQGATASNGTGNQTQTTQPANAPATEQNGPATTTQAPAGVEDPAAKAYPAPDDVRGAQGTSGPSSTEANPNAPKVDTPVNPTV